MMSWTCGRPWKHALTIPIETSCCPVLQSHLFICCVFTQSFSPRSGTPHLQFCKDRFCLHLLRCEAPLCDDNVVKDTFQITARIKASMFTWEELWIATRFPLSRRAGFGAENEASEGVFPGPRALLFTCLESEWVCLRWITTHPNPLSNNVRCERKLICFQFWCFLAIVNTLRLSCNRPRALKPSPVWKNTKKKKCFHYSFFPLFLILSDCFFFVHINNHHTKPKDTYLLALAQLTEKFDLKSAQWNKSKQPSM